MKNWKQEGKGAYYRWEHPWQPFTDVEGKKEEERVAREKWED